MKWLSFITFFSLNPPQFIRGGVPRHNNAKTHFHGSPHCRMSMKGETTDFLCKRTFWKGKERRQLILLLQMTSVFCLGGLRVVEPAWLLLTHFNSADAGAWLIAGVASHHHTSVCPRLCTHTHTRMHTFLVFPVQTLARYRENRSASASFTFALFELCNAVSLRETEGVLFRNRNSTASITVWESEAQTSYVRKQKRQRTVC